MTNILKIKLSALAILAIVTIGVTFTSCQKEINLSKKDSGVNALHTNNSLTGVNLTYDDLDTCDQEVIDSLAESGTQHNEGLDYVYDQLVNDITTYSAISDFDSRIDQLFLDITIHSKNYVVQNNSADVIIQAGVDYYAMMEFQLILILVQKKMFFHR